MKKHYAILIVFILALNPILASATVSDTDDNPQPTQVNNSENESIPQPNNAPQEPEPVIDDPTPVPLNNDNDVPEISKDTTEPSTSNTTDATNDDLPKTDTPEEGDDAKEPSDAEADTDGTNTDVEIEADAEESEAEEETEEKVHVHSFKYTGNKDGTHTVTCTEAIEPDDDSDEEADTECSYEEIEPCEYNEDGICIYCGDKKPDEEEEFAPSMSFSISNQSFTMGGPNPVISVNIWQDDYDIEYAQVCFANYGENKFINVGLAQGKYFDFITDDFVYTSNDSWCASPDITTDYSTGTYSLRSIYVRSTTGESIHYSIESDSLPEEYQNIDISLNMDASQSNISNIMNDSLIDITAFDETAETEIMETYKPDSVFPELVSDIVADEAPDIIEDKPRNDISDIPVFSEPAVPEAKEETSVEPIKEEIIEEVSEKLIEEPQIEELAITQANNTESKESNDSNKQSIKDTITESITTEDEQPSISPDIKEETKTDNENIKEEVTSNEEKTPTATESQQSPITQFFNNVFNFMKKLFKWW